MVELEVFAGVCGFTTLIRAKDTSRYKAVCTIESECPNCRKLGDAIGNQELNVMDELFKKGKSQVMKAAQANIPHLSCPVAAGILKALEVSAGLAIPKDVTMKFK